MTCFRQDNYVMLCSCNYVRVQGCYYVTILLSSVLAELMQAHTSPHVCL